MAKMIEASVAMLKVIEAWDVKQIYGYAGGSFNSTMHALDVEQERLQYVQVRHEQVGALAAAADAKLTGKIGVAFGSAGPGAVNLLNGLYDAKEDHVPVLALVGQVAHTNMNYDYFQEFAEEPIFSDVAVFNRTVMTPESLPYVVDKAIRTAYRENGVAVVTIPNDFGYVEIPDLNYDSASVPAKLTGIPTIDDEQVKTVLTMIKNAKYPVFHVGQGTRGATEDMMALAERLQVPIIITGLAKGVIPDSFDGNMGSAYRAASKAADELMGITDLVVSVGADYSFAQIMYTTHDFKYVQIELDPGKFGRHHHLDFGVNGDAKVFINRVAADDAVFSMDVGDNTINSFRFLKMNPKQKLLTSALFATMGAGVPGAIAAKMSYPDRQAFNIAGDGAFSMVMQDLLTEVKYHLPIFNIVTSNQTLNFIKSEQEDVPQPYYGIDLIDADFAKIAEGMGVKGIRVEHFDQLHAAFETAMTELKAGRPVLIDAKITDKRGLPVEILDVDPTKTSDASVSAFKEKYDANELKPLTSYFKEFNVE